MPEPTTQDRFKRGAADAGRYFDFMAQFINFQPEHAEAIRASTPPRTNVPMPMAR